jgi:hypothetical protein
MLLVRSIAVYVAVALACLTCGAATAAGVRSGTLSVTAHVVNSVPTVRLVDAHGKVMTHTDVTAAVQTRTENSVVYLVLEY